VCVPCASWNLLGADAALAALPKLVARTTGQVSPGGFAFHRVDKALDLIRVSDAAGQEPSSQQLLALRTLLDRCAIRRRLKLAAGLLAIISLIGLLVLLARIDAVIPLLALFDLLSVLLAGQVAFWIGQRRRNLLALTANAALLAFALWALHQWTPHALTGSDLSLPIIQFGGLLFVALTLPRRTAVRAGVGYRATRISFRQLVSVTMSWDDGSNNISFHDLPDDAYCDGEAARTLAAKIFAAAASYGVSRPAFQRPVRSADAAYQLLNGLGGLRGILDALDGFRRDLDGRVPLADIPTIYLRALDLAFTTAQGNGEEFGLDGLADAQRTAAVAEGLDREIAH
jgi:hypothetical protein